MIRVLPHYQCILTNAFNFWTSYHYTILQFVQDVYYYCGLILPLVQFVIFLCSGIWQIYYVTHLNQRKHQIVQRVMLNHSVHAVQVHVISKTPFYQFLEHPLTLVGLKKQIAFKCFMVSRPLVSTLSKR